MHIDFCFAIISIQTMENVGEVFFLRIIVLLYCTTCSLNAVFFIRTLKKKHFDIFISFAN